MHDTEEAERLKGDRKIPLGSLLRRTVRYARPELSRFLLSGLLILVNVGLDIILPLFTKDITETLTGEMTINHLHRVIVVVILYFLISALNQVFLYFESMILQKAGQNIIYTLRMDVFTHIEEMSQNQFTEMPVGALVTRVTSYTQSLSDLFTNVLVSVIRNLLTLIGVYGIMIYLSPRLSLILLIPMVLVFVSSLIFSKYIGKTFRAERKNLSELNAFLNENLSGMKITQIFNQEERKLDEFDGKNEQLRKSKFRSIIGFGLYRPFISFIYFSSNALAFFVGVQGGLDAAEIVAFYLYLSKFYNPIQMLADQVNNIQKALTASERLFNLLDVQPEVRDAPDAEDVERFEGRIEFSHVWFAYQGEDWILKDVSFVIEPRQTCAFVGATGAGKTTILSLIVRNYEIQKGEIRIDGKDISKIRIKSLRRAVGQMLQDVFLFSGTIRSNVTLHDESFSEEDVREACRYVNADSFIDRLPNGMDEEVLERGENFSQGQRQLLSFARAVLHRPQILILDEATANIDTETEVLIQESLEKIKNIGTMLVVAHRLSTIQHADQIIVLQNGEIIERGNHQELLRRHGYYYKLYELQFENQ
ncbi:MAG: ABC transporter ATP-binding protein [Clostridia bacterium]|nr:ABC transporter ATP-binding protein [Clostridia bacterium]